MVLFWFFVRTGRLRRSLGKQRGLFTVLKNNQLTKIFWKTVRTDLGAIKDY